MYINIEVRRYKTLNPNKIIKPSLMSFLKRQVFKFIFKSTNTVRFTNV